MRAKQPDTTQNLNLGRYRDEVVIEIGLSGLRLAPLDVVGLIKALAAICEDIITNPTPPDLLVVPDKPPLII